MNLNCLEQAGRLPGGSDSKESACNAGDLGLILGFGISPAEGNGYPLQYSSLGNSMDRGAWQATVIFSSHRKLSDNGVCKKPKDCKIHVKNPLVRLGGIQLLGSVMFKSRKSMPFKIFPVISIFAAVSKPEKNRYCV